MRLLNLLITVTLCVRAALANECVPTEHQITSEPIRLGTDGSVMAVSDGKPLSSVSQTYCTYRDYGGGQGCFSWSYVGDMCCDKANIADPCPCSHSVDTCSYPSCKCHMQGDTEVSFCFKEQGQCPYCPAGQFAVGCGCVNCKKNVGTYEPDIYKNEYSSCNEETPPKWVCGPGSCQKCPAGHKCAGGNTAASHCPAGVSYQPASGQTECLPCVCKNNQYVPKTKLLSDCGGAVGMDGLCVSCDACTPHGDMTDPSPTQQCPERNWAYGRDALGQCRPCEPCEGKTNFSLVGVDHDFCNMNASTCRAYYYKPRDNEPPTSQNLASADAIGEGEMPFVMGWQRNPGTQHKPGPPVPLDGYGSLLGHQAILPYYSPCVNTMPNSVFVTASAELQAIMDNEYNQPYDCNPHYTAQCQNGYTGDTLPQSDVVGIPYLSACVPCPPNTDASCRCSAGYALASDLDLVLQQSPRHLYDKGTCIHCATQVYILDRENRMQNEAMLCTGRCEGRQILTTVNDVPMCTDCPPKYIPKPNRMECKICPVGYYSVSVSQNGVDGRFWDCVACDNDPPTFSSQPGQTACTPKRSRCNDGQKLIVNNDDTRDNDCMDCEDDCALGEMKIMYANATGSCNSQGQLYFGCISMSQGVKAGFPLNTRFAYGSGDDLAMAHVEVDECLNLPPYASWVAHDPNMAGKQCYFACDYGVASDAYHQTVIDYVMRERVDLRAFLPSDTVTFEPKSIRYISTFGYLADAQPLTDWLVYKELVTETSCPECHHTFATNTFLMIDIPPPIDMCMSPTQASLLSQRCEHGFAHENGTTMPKCALLARLGMYKSQPLVSGNLTLLPSSYYVNPSCRSDDTKLQAFQVPCTRHCLTERHDRATTASNALFPGSLEFMQMSYIKFFLSGETWRARGFNPYQHPTDNQCEPTTCAAGTFRFNAGAHYACIPCDSGPQLCSSLYVPQRFFNAHSCADATQEATADVICYPCEPTKDYAVLITHMEGTPRVPGSTMFKDWWDVRTMQAAYSTYFTSDTSESGWEAITCRYKCAEGYTSNNASPHAYKRQPCVPLPTSFPTCPLNASVYYEQASASVSGLSPRNADNYIPYMLRCAPCLSNEHIFQPTLTPVSAQGLCMALCDPQRKLHTIRDGLPTTSYSPLQTVTCAPCSDRPQLPCAAACPPGRFLRDSECVPCDTTPCTQLGFFRGPCSGTTDSRCLPCDPSLLYNSPTRWGVNTELALELQNLVNVSTRRWVLSGCTVACINNHVWIDVTTGRFAANSSLTKACIPCESGYVKTRLLSTARTLYSVWNSTNTTADTVPAGGSLEPGSCFFCPVGHDTLNFGSDIMCDSMPGYTFSGQGSSGTAEVVDVLQNHTTHIIAPSMGHMQIQFRRRLLSITEPTKNIRVRRQPLVSAQGGYFRCCTESTLTHMQKCWSLNLKELELKKMRTGGEFGADYCDETGEAPPAPPEHEISACFSGNFKPTRGTGPCYVCPAGASTFSDSATSYADCQCLQGFRAVREPGVAGALQHCVACGHGFYRSPLQKNDSYCLPCPPNTHTPTESSGYCYCYAGSYMLANGSCVLCEQGFYCGSDNNRVACPLHSTTPGPGASTRGECQCLAPVYFGDLSVNVSSECIYIQPGYNCSRQFDQSLCPCAQGWTATDHGCMSSCPMGTYAVLGERQSIERCVPCPVDTYGDTNQTVYIPMLPLSRQCTPCPPNTRTAGVGATSCACNGVQNGSSCQLCGLDQYFDPVTQTCYACPAGTKAAPASVGINSCLCPRGYRAKRQILQNHQLLQCEPCPMGYFSSDVGSSCTPCPAGLRTPSPGATSRLQCV